MSRLADDRSRTAVFARYSLVGALAAAAGSLAAAVPAWLVSQCGISTRGALQAMFSLYSFGAVAVALSIAGLPPPRRRARTPPAPLTRSKAASTRSPRSSASTLRGGLVVQSLMALWLYQRHGLSARDRRLDLLLDRRALGACRSSSRCASPSASAW
jgi:hypothetical protein